jgi:transposase
MAGHPDAPLTPEGRLRLCLRIDAGRPITHVAVEAGTSRRCLGKWYARWRAHGEGGLLDRSSRPSASPTGTGQDIADLVEVLRRQTKHGPARLAADLERLHGVTLAPATVHRILVRRGLNRLRDLDPPTGEQLREVIRYEHDHVGDLVHFDIKKLGRIPDGGGWRMHGLGTEAARASRRHHRRGPGAHRGIAAGDRAAWTSTKSAAAPAGTGTSPWPCSRTPSSRRWPPPRPKGGRRNGESGLASFTVAEVRRLLRTLPCAELVSLAHPTSGPRPPLPLPTPNCRAQRRNRRGMTVRQPSRLQIRLLTCVNGETLVY